MITSTLCFIDLKSWINLVLIGDIFWMTTNWKPQNYSSTNKYEHKLKTKVTFRIISLWIQHQTNTYFQLKPNRFKHSCQTRYFLIKYAHLIGKSYVTVDKYKNSPIKMTKNRLCYEKWDFRRSDIAIITWQ